MNDLDLEEAKLIQKWRQIRDWPFARMEVIKQNGRMIQISVTQQEKIGNL